MVIWDSSEQSELHRNLCFTRYPLTSRVVDFFREEDFKVSMVHAAVVPERLGYFSHCQLFVLMSLFVRDILSVLIGKMSRNEVFVVGSYDCDTWTALAM